MERLLRKETERKYQPGDTVQDILRRAREFRISSSAFKFSTNERKVKMNYSYDATQKYPYNVYPDMADCLDSTIEGFSMMPFSHQWLLQSGSKRSEKQHAVNKNAHMKPKSLLAEKEKDGHLQNNKNNIELQKERDAEQKPVRIDTMVDQKSVQIDNRADQKPLCIDNGTDQKTTVLPFSLDDYMAAMDRAQQTLLKYSTTEQEKDIDKENPVKQQVNTSDRNIEEKTAADTADQYSKEKAKDSNKRKKQEDTVDTINKINKQSVRVDTINKENMAVDNTNKDIKQEGRVDIDYRNTNLKEKVDTMNKEEHKDIVEYDKEKAETTGTLCKGIKGEAREDTINKDTKRVVDIISNKDKDANADASIKHESTVDNNRSREDAEDQFGGHDVLIDTGKQKDDWKPIVVAVNTTGKGDPKTKNTFLGDKQPEENITPEKSDEDRNFSVTKNKDDIEERVNVAEIENHNGVINTPDKNCTKNQNIETSDQGGHLEQKANKKHNEKQKEQSVKDVKHIKTIDIGEHFEKNAGKDETHKYKEVSKNKNCKQQNMKSANAVLKNDKRNSKSSTKNTDYRDHITKTTDTMNSTASTKNTDYRDDITKTIDTMNSTASTKNTDYRDDITKTTDTMNSTASTKNTDYRDDITKTIDTMNSTASTKNTDYRDDITKTTDTMNSTASTKNTDYRDDITKTTDTMNSTASTKNTDYRDDITKTIDTRNSTASTKNTDYRDDITKTIDTMNSTASTKNTDYRDDITKTTDTMNSTASTKNTDYRDDITKTIDTMNSTASTKNTDYRDDITKTIDTRNSTASTKKTDYRDDITKTIDTRNSTASAANTDYKQDITKTTDQNEQTGIGKGYIEEYISFTSNESYKQQNTETCYHESRQMKARVEKDNIEKNKACTTNTNNKEQNIQKLCHMQDGQVERIGIVDTEGSNKGLISVDVTEDDIKVKSINAQKYQHGEVVDNKVGRDDDKKHIVKIDNIEEQMLSVVNKNNMEEFTLTTAEKHSIGQIMTKAYQGGTMDTMVDNEVEGINESSANTDAQVYKEKYLMKKAGHGDREKPGLNIQDKKCLNDVDKQITKPPGCMTYNQSNAKEHTLEKFIETCVIEVVEKAKLALMKEELKPKVEKDDIEKHKTCTTNTSYKEQNIKNLYHMQDGQIERGQVDTEGFNQKPVNVADTQDDDTVKVSNVQKNQHRKVHNKEDWNDNWKHFIKIANIEKQMQSVVNKNDTEERNLTSTENHCTEQNKSMDYQGDKMDTMDDFEQDDIYKLMAEHGYKACKGEPTGYPAFCNDISDIDDKTYKGISTAYPKIPDDIADTEENVYNYKGVCKVFPIVDDGREKPVLKIDSGNDPMNIFIKNVNQTQDLCTKTLLHQVNNGYDDESTTDQTEDVFTNKHNPDDIEPVADDSREVHSLEMIGDQRKVDESETNTDAQVNKERYLMKTAGHGDADKSGLNNRDSKFLNDVVKHITVPPVLMTYSQTDTKEDSLQKFVETYISEVVEKVKLVLIEEEIIRISNLEDAASSWSSQQKSYVCCGGQKEFCITENYVNSAIRDEYCKGLEQFRHKLFGRKESAVVEGRPRKHITHSFISTAYGSHVLGYTEVHILCKKSWRERMRGLLLCVRTRQ